jgi:hypothetical protein
VRLPFPTANGFFVDRSFRYRGAAVDIIELAISEAGERSDQHEETTGSSKIGKPTSTLQTSSGRSGSGRDSRRRLAEPLPGEGGD